MTPKEISDTLHRDIVNGNLLPGSPLSQKKLAAQFNVSRIPVRDALAHLATTGVIELSPNKTAKVIKLGRAALIEIYDLRRLLEGDLLRRAIPLMTKAHLADIDHAFDTSNIAAFRSEWAIADALFHSTLYTAAGRPRQLALIEQLRNVCRLHSTHYVTLPKKTEEWLTDHKLIRDLCHAGLVKTTAKALDEHLARACDALLLELPQDPP